MIKVKRIINNNNWKLKADDEITLDSLDRNRRRIALITKKKVAFLLDQKKTVFLNNGSVKRLSTKTVIVLSALSLTTMPCNSRFGILTNSSWPLNGYFSGDGPIFFRNN